MSIDIAEYFTLSVLKHGREQMVQDFLEQKPEIYAPSYKYEKSPNVLELEREKYFLTWLSSHWKVFNNAIEDYSEDDRREIEEVFAKAFLSLLNRWIDNPQTSVSQFRLSILLIEDMRLAIQKLIEAGDKAEVMRNRLRVAIEKNNALFVREIEKRTRGDI